MAVDCELLARVCGDGRLALASVNLLSGSVSDWIDDAEKKATAVTSSAGCTLLHLCLLLMDTGQAVEMRVCGPTGGGTVTQLLQGCGVHVGADCVVVDGEECVVAGVGEAAAAEDWPARLRTWSAAQVDAAAADLLRSHCTRFLARFVPRAAFHAALLAAHLINSPLKDTPWSSPAGSGPLDGITPLHLAALKGNLSVCRMLVSSGAQVQSRACGTLFGPGRATYYGEYALSIAVSTGRRDIAESVIAGQAREPLLSAADSAGNTAAHLAVLHGRPDMLTWLVRRGAPLDTVNSAGLTPVRLAARIGGVDEVLAALRVGEWQLGTVRCTVLPLHDVDSALAPRSVLEEAALHSVLSAADSTVLAEVLERKWRRWGRTATLLTLAVHGVQLWVLAAAAGGAGDDWSWGSADTALMVLTIGALAVWLLDLTLAQRRRLLRVADEDAAATAVVPPPSIPESSPRWADIVAEAGAALPTPPPAARLCILADAADAAEAVGQALVLIHFCLRFAGGHDEAQLVLALASVALWLSTLRFSVLHRETGTLHALTEAACARDLIPFSAVLCLAVCGYAVAIRVLDATHGHDISDAMLELFRLLQGDVPRWGQERADRNPELVFALAVAFVLTTAFLLTAVLTARVVDTLRGPGRCILHQRWWLWRTRRVLAMERRALALRGLCCGRLLAAVTAEVRTTARFTATQPASCATPTPVPAAAPVAAPAAAPAAAPIAHATTQPTSQPAPPPRSPTARFPYPASTETLATLTTTDRDSSASDRAPSAPAPISIGSPTSPFAHVPKREASLPDSDGLTDGGLESGHETQISSVESLFPQMPPELQAVSMPPVTAPDYAANGAQRSRPSEGPRHHAAGSDARRRARHAPASVPVSMPAGAPPRQPIRGTVHSAQFRSTLPAPDAAQQWARQPPAAPRQPAPPTAADPDASPVRQSVRVHADAKHAARLRPALRRGVHFLPQADGGASEGGESAATMLQKQFLPLSSSGNMDRGDDGSNSSVSEEMCRLHASRRPGKMNRHLTLQ